MTVPPDPTLEASDSEVVSKDHPRELACLGGKPAFTTSLHVGRPNVGDVDRVLARMRDVLERRWLTNNGPCVVELEEALQRFLGVRHCVATCNATLALELTARAAGMRGEVLVPSFTFVATAHALAWQGLTPVFCDVDAETGSVDPESVRRAISERTSGLVAVHLWGRPCAVDALEDIAAEHGLQLVFDAAHAFGCSYRGRLLGANGRAEVFSFHATKVVNAFEGGAVATDDAELAEEVRRLRNFGFAGEDRVVSLGTNAKMSEASAAMALTSLESLDRFVAWNRRNWEAYRDGLAGVAAVRLLPYDEGERSNYHYVVLTVADDAGLGRDELQRVLRAENVLARRYFFPGCDLSEAYRRSARGPELPATRRLAARVLSLPTGTAVGVEEVRAVCAIMRLALEDPELVAAALAREEGAPSPRAAGAALGRA